MSIAEHVGDAADVGEAESDRPSIEGYHVLAHLGSGGMSSVWRARQLSTNREVALKLLGYGFASTGSARARFQREVEVMAKLNHPGIASVFDSGVHQGCFYYAMELVRGEHLDRYLAARCPSPDAVASLIADVADAVDHAHQHGVIHRDLKPSNILVDDDGRPHVVDFGLAKILDPPRDAQVTEAGALAGTPEYMAPEQAAGDTASATTRTDVYTLGVILFRELSGHWPHPESDSRHEALRRIARHEPRRLRSLAPSLRRDLEAIVHRAIALDPDDRYGAAGGLAADLRRYLNGAPVLARPMTARYVMLRWLTRNRRRVAGASVGLALATLLGVVVWVGVDQAHTEASRRAEAARRMEYVGRINAASEAIAQADVSRALAELDACPVDLRRWEWRYLHRRADQSAMTVDAAQGRPLAWWVSGTADRVITFFGDGRVADFRQGKGTTIAARIDGRLDAAAISPDGGVLAFLAGDELRVLNTDRWLADPPDVATTPFPGTRRIVATDATVVAGREGGSVVGIGPRDGRVVWEHAAPAGKLIAWTDGRRAALVEGPRVTILDAQRGEPLARYGVGSDRIRHIDVVDGRIALATERGIEILDPDQNGLGTRRIAISGGVGHLSWCGDPETLAYIDHAGRLGVLKIDQPRAMHRLLGHAAPVVSIRWLDQAGLLASVDRSGATKTWRIDRVAGQPMPTLELADRFMAMDVADGTLLVGELNGDLSWADAAGATHTWPVPFGDDPVLVVAVAPTGSQAAVGTASGVVAVVDLNSRSILARARLPQGQPELLRFSSDGRTLRYAATIGRDAAWRWHWPSDQPVRLATQGYVVGLWDDDRLACVSDMSVIRAITVRKEGAPTALQRIEVTGGGKWQPWAAASSIVLTEVGNGITWITGAGEVKRLTGARDKSQSPMWVDLSSDGARLLIADQSISVWDTTTGSMLLELEIPGVDDWRCVRLDAAHDRVIAATRKAVYTWSIRSAE